MTGPAPLAAVPVASSTSLRETPGFPEAPLPHAASLAADAPHKPSVDMADRYDKYILPGQSAPRLTAHDKFILGVKDTITPFAITGWLSSAGYEQIFNNAPNYGQTGEGFAQRLGASAARASSEGFFSDSILAPILHEDPRYYKLGRGHNVVNRTVYSVSRIFITKTDSGHRTLNAALLGGNLAGAVLTNAYYPDINRNFKDTAETFGGSVGGSALGLFISEFLSDTLQAVHLKDRD